MQPARPRTLIICLEAVGAEMAGSGIRAYELARVLRAHCDVTVAALAPAREDRCAPRPGEDGIEVVHYERNDPRPLRRLIAGADAIVAQPQRALVAAWLRRSQARLIFDLYDPEPFEVMEILAGRGRRRRRMLNTTTLDRILDSFHSGHHFVCASGKQRDLWIGAMLAARLIGPDVYDRDPSLLSVIDEVPFGLPVEPPRPGGEGPRERFGLDAGEEIVLWNGGIWNWLDAEVAIRAMAVLGARRPRARLVFMGAAAGAPAARATEDARRLASELGLLDTVVFFHDQWVAYEQRAAWLCQADCAVSTHVEHLETRFAFRTRLLDCFWAGLPVVCTRGDELAARVERDGLGAAVPERDANAVAAGIEQVLARGRAGYADALARAAADYAWPLAAAPLVRFITATERPPRLGDGVRRPVPRAARSAAIATAMAATSATGLNWWPQP